MIKQLKDMRKKDRMQYIYNSGWNTEIRNDKDSYFVYTLADWFEARDYVNKNLDKVMMPTMQMDEGEVA